jgi:hypothetical protein
MNAARRPVDGNPPGPPGLLLTLLEWRAYPEYFASLWSQPLLRQAPRGDGHPVIVVPGFMGNAGSTWLLRRYLRALGHRVYDWGHGRNTGPVGTMEHSLLERVQSVHRRTGRRPSLVGWSLGGLYARILAHEEPAQLRSIGAPLRHPHRSSVDRLYARFSGQDVRLETLRHIAAAPPVPSTSIYSRLDGIVSWRACLSDEGERAENICVPSSHCGLAHHPLTLWIVADRLAQPEDAWSPFSVAGNLKRVLTGSTRRGRVREA